MIFTDRTIIVQKGTSSINDTIILYRGDKGVEIRFTLNEGSPFRFGSGASPNIIEKTEAAYGQLIIKRPNDLPAIFSEIAPTNEGKIIFTITAEMIDEITEVGNYTFQIRLLDESMNSRATLPEVNNGIEIREPIATEDVSTTNEVGKATVGYALTTAATPEDAFDSQGNYNKTTWATGDRITAAKLDKIEAGIDGVNNKIASAGTSGGSNINDTTASATTTYSSNKIENIKENLSSQIKDIEDYVNGIEVTYEEVSVSGTTIELTDVGKTDIAALTIEGNTYLSGSDPSTSNVRTISILDNFTLTNNGENFVTINTQLMRIADTFDELNLKTGALTRRIKKVVLTGEENWTVEQYASQKYRYFTNVSEACANDTNLYKMGDSNVPYLRCTHYTSCGVEFYAFNDTCSFPYNGGNKLGICPANYNMESNVDGFKSYLQEQYNAGTPVTVYYVLATPTEENVLVDNVSLSIGSNIITTNGDLKSNIHLTYYKKVASSSGGSGTGTNSSIFLLTDESTEDISSISNECLILDDRSNSKDTTPTAFHPTMNVNDVIIVGNTLRYYASIEPSYADQSCEWQSSDATKATVSKVRNGFACDVLGISAGKVIITCTPKNTSLPAVSISITISEVN